MTALGKSLRRWCNVIILTVRNVIGHLAAVPPRQQDQPRLNWRHGCLACVDRNKPMYSYSSERYHALAEKGLDTEKTSQGLKEHTVRRPCHNVES